MNQDVSEILTKLRRIEAKLDELIASQQSPSPDTPVKENRDEKGKPLPKRRVLGPHDEVGA